MTYPMNAALTLSFLAGLFILAGCAHQRGLKSPGIERTCTRWRCYVSADADTVNRRCTKRKIAWDDGTPYQPSGDRVARCCTVLRRLPKRLWIWVTEGQEDCLVHEELHIEIFQDDGMVFIPEHHKQVHEFGLKK